MLNENFADGIVEVRYKTDIVCFSVHRVFLAGKLGILQNIHGFILESS